MAQDTAVRVRPARATDVDGILALIRALAEYEKLGDELALDRQGMLQALFGLRPVAEAMVADHGDARAPELVGYALCFRSFSTFLCRPGLYLEDLFVLPDWRGRGIGLALLRGICARAVARGHGRVEWSVLDWNTPAIDFYRRLGATHQPEWQRFRLDGEALQRMGAAGE